MDTEDVTNELLNHLTEAQLHYIVQRIQQLCYVAPDHAKYLLTENPQTSLALLHAEYLVGAKADKLLPLTSDEVKLAKERYFQMRNPGGKLPPSYAAASVTPASTQKTNEVANALSKLDSSVLSALSGGAEVVDMAAIVQSLLEMSDEQIALLPEEVQVVLLTALQSTM